jgi:homoserine kinase type II
VPSDTERELNEVLAQYDLGALAKTDKNTRGFVNTAYVITTVRSSLRRSYFLRKYRTGIREEELQFEHSLIEHLSSNGSCPVARLHPTFAGTTYFHRMVGPGGTQDAFYAIFDLLPGEDRYTWVGPNCTDRELEASAATLAQFHRAVRGFTPAGRRAEPKIIELLPTIEEYWRSCPAKSKGNAFDGLVVQALESVSGSIEGVRARLSLADAALMPEMVIHCDFHPGNLKFEGERVCGLFDFDWSKVDWRAFDVALAVWYFCASWEAEDDGQLRMDKAARFLGSYQKVMREERGASALSLREMSYLPDLIQAANLYILHWGVADYYTKDVDPEEYLVFLQHGSRFTTWFEAPGTRARLEEMCSSLARRT